MGSLRRISNIQLKNETFNVVDKILENPYEFGGTKRIHIGDTAVAVESEKINERSKKMREVGYSSADYFIEFNNDMLSNVQKDLENKYDLSYTHSCVIIIPPGQCMPAHSDTYSYLVKYMKRDFGDVSYDLKQDVRRYLVFLKDWQSGQSIGAEDNVKCSWNSGDVYEWNYKSLHWCSNSGLSPIVFFEITGLNLN